MGKRLAEEDCYFMFNLWKRLTPEQLALDPSNLAKFMLAQMKEQLPGTQQRDESEKEYTQRKEVAALEGFEVQRMTAETPEQFAQRLKKRGQVS